ncbi:MAG: PEP-CTERM sorting domain-containing protein [Armatimonadetes bacterium]|nr:PEP-CTERM sorting domain-containing protein [Armatimonadota bacterium]
MKRTLILALFAAVGAGAQAQVINFTGALLQENFDSLSNTGTANSWANGSTINGWYAANVSGNITTYRADNGSGTTGALYSFGSTGSTERALGSISSGTPQTIVYGARIQNNSAGAVTDFTLSYNGEQWRNGGNTAVQKLTFEYSLNATAINDGAATWTAVTNLDFNSPVTGSTAAAVDGNVAGRVPINTALLPTVLSSNWNLGSDLWIRWTDINDAGSDHGLGIDDMQFTATVVPEPATLVALGAGLAAFARRRRR